MLVCSLNSGKVAGCPVIFQMQGTRKMCNYIQLITLITIRLRNYNIFVPIPMPEEIIVMFASTAIKIWWKWNIYYNQFSWVEKF